MRPARPLSIPKILLKVILVAYSKGMLSSRQIERACQENIIFIALSYGYAPDHSTIAAFISSMQSKIQTIFSNILLVCEEMGLLGGTHFSLDGVKLSANVSKEWSGTFDASDFSFDASRKVYLCPHGKELRCHERNQPNRYRTYDVYHARVEDCAACPLRTRCLSKSTASRRYLSFQVETQPPNLIDEMKAKIDGGCSSWYTISAKSTCSGH